MHVYEIIFYEGNNIYERILSRITLSHMSEFDDDTSISESISMSDSFKEFTGKIIKLLVVLS